MKRLMILISLLMTGQVLAYGTSKEDTTSAITFFKAVGMDSVFYSAGQDTTSWEINRREMSRAFSPDSTNYALRDTFDNPGTYWVKIEYWEGGAASAKYLPDIRYVKPSIADVNMVQIADDANAAESLGNASDGYDNAGLTAFEKIGLINDTAKEILDSAKSQDDWVAHQTSVDSMRNANDTLAANVVSVDTDAIAVGDFATGAIDSDALADDIHFDSLSLRTITVVNDQSYPALYVESSGDNAVEFTSSFSGGHALLAYASLGGDGAKFQSGGGSGHGLQLLASSGNGLSAVSTSGNDIDGDITGNLSGSVGSVTDTADTRARVVKMDGGLITNTVIANNAIGNDELADDLTFDSLKFRTIIVFNSAGDVVYLNSSANNKVGMRITGTGTNSDGMLLSGTNSDFNVMLQGLNFSDAYWDSIANRSDSGAAGGTGLDSATTSRIVGRKIWGITAGSGSDSSTKAQRRVGWVDTTNYAVNVPGAGTGINACSLWVYDTGNTVMVSGIMVQAENSSGANQGRNRSNVSGISVLNLNDGDYNLRIPMNSGHIQITNPQPFTVSGATNDTINITWFSPTIPLGDLTTLYNWVVDGSDQPIASANVEAMIPREFWPVTNSRKGIDAKRSVKTDSTGLWELPIWGNDIVLTDQGDSSSFWMVTITYLGQEISRNKVTVSSDSTTQLMVPDAD